MSESHVDAAVAARIAAARRRTEDMRRQRAELAAARKRGLAARHTQKLQRLASAVGFRDWLTQNYRREEFAVLVPLAVAPGTWTSAEALHEELHRSGADARTCVLISMAKDAWLGMTGQWQYDCADCGADSTTERYMVHHHVWAAAGMCPFGFLCIGCIEQRLGRRLVAADFLDVPLNHAPGFQRSDRLASRLSHAGGDQP